MEKDVTHLVLSRKVEESFWIGDSEVTVIRIGPNSVRISIKAPRSTHIVRSELLLKVAGSAESA